MVLTSYISCKLNYLHCFVNYLCSFFRFFIFYILLKEISSFKETCIVKYNMLPVPANCSAEPQKFPMSCEGFCRTSKVLPLPPELHLQNKTIKNICRTCQPNKVSVVKVKIICKQLRGDIPLVRNVKVVTGCTCKASDKCK